MKKSNASQYGILTVLGLGLLPAAPLGQTKANVPSARVAPAASILSRSDCETPADLNLDPALDQPVTLSDKNKSLTVCLHSLSKASGIRLTASPTIAKRRITLFCSHTQLRRVLMAIADTTNLTWRKPISDSPAAGNDLNSKSTPKSESGYELFQTSVAESRERGWISISQKREELADQAQRDGVLTAIQKAIADRKPGQASIADLLANITPAQQQQAADLASQPIGVGSIGNASQFYNHLLNSTPFNSLPPDVQASVRAQLQQPDPMPASHFASALNNLDDLANCQIGLVAAYGGLTLGVVKPDGSDLWVSPSDRVSRKGIPGVDSDDDTEPEAGDALREHLVTLTGVPAALRKKPLRFPPGLERTQIAPLLESIASQTGLAIVSDDFLHSNQGPFSSLLTDQDTYTLPEALDQIARGFGHEIEYRAGALRVKTLTPGLDLRAEPPDALLTRLQVQAQKKQGMELQDFVAMGRCSRVQLEMLTMRQMTPPVHIDTRMMWMRPLLHFYALLTPKQRTQAERPEGLSPSRMDAAQEQAFLNLTNVGMPEKEAKYSTGGVGLHVLREQTETSESLTLVITSDQTPPRRASYLITASRPAPPAKTRN